MSFFLYVIRKEINDIVMVVVGVKLLIINC